MLEFLPARELIRVQLAYRLWYENVIPPLIESLNTDLGILVRKTNEMLASEPIGAGQYKLAQWKNQRRLTVADLKFYWDQIEKDAPLFDLVNAEFRSGWSYEQPGMDEPVKCWGMCHKVTNAPHGIVRGIPT